jgi:hypothetical protein
MAVWLRVTVLGNGSIVVGEGVPDERVAQKADARPSARRWLTFIRHLY